MLHVCSQQVDIEGLVRRKGLLVALVYVDWCPFSLIAKSQVELLAERTNNIPIFKIAADNYTSLPKPFSTASFPTLFVIFDGVVALRLPGLQTGDRYIELAEQLSKILPDRRDEIDNARFSFRASLFPRKHNKKVIGKSRLVFKREDHPTPAKTVFLDPTLSAIALLFFIAREANRDQDLISEGAVGTYYKDALYDVRLMLKTARNSSIPAISNEVRRKNGYFSRQISRLNAISNQEIGFPLLERFGAGYKINSRYSTRISLDDFNF